LTITTVHNPHSKLGQASSVRLGLEALMSNYDVLLIALCDQPLVGTIEIDALLQQYERRDQQKEILLPMVGEQRGNPVVFSRKVITDILAIPQMVCRPLQDGGTDGVLARTCEPCSILVNIIEILSYLL
jgi:molybdenum cofactor cytidylyltransferase/nicotine blue oxidoreductase